MTKEEIMKKITETRSLIKNKDTSEVDKKKALTTLRSLVDEYEASKDLDNMENIVGKDSGEPEQRNKKFPQPKQHTKRNKIVDEDDPKIQRRSAINDYLHSKGSKRSGLLDFTSEQDVIIPNDLTRDATPGIKSDDVAPVIPKAISYVPQDEVKTIVDLAKYVNRVAVKTASGSYPVRKKATGRLNTVGELEKNPDLKKPNFKDVDYKVETRRGAEPVSQESIDDAAIDLIPFLIVDANEQKVNTTNYDISNVLKTFAPITIKSLDDIKKINNTGLNLAYNRSFVVSGSFYQWLDTLKDNNGRYLLHDDITSASGKSLLDVPVFKIDDDLLGAKGEAHAWFGDLKKGVFFADRAQITARWVDNDTYGQLLQIGTRYDVKVADDAAGYFMTLDPKATSDDKSTVEIPDNSGETDTDTGSGTDSETAGK